MAEHPRQGAPGRLPRPGSGRARAAEARSLGRRHRRLVAILAGCGALATAGLCLAAPVDWLLRVLLAVVAALVWAALGLAVRESVTAPLRGLTAVVEALRVGDHSIRARGARPGEAMGELALEVNQLADAMRAEHLRALEATALLEELLRSVDVAVLAFDGLGVLRLLNPAAARLLGAPAPALLGRSAVELGLADLVPDEPGTRLVEAVAGHAGRWQVTHGSYREGGLAQHLLVVTDVRRTLREEERAAWQRLLRVMGHEVKNSLAPIRSIAGTIRSIVSRELPEGPRRADVLEGLQVVEERSGALDRFLAQYRRLAQVPPPRPTRTEVAGLLRRVAALAPSPVAIHADERLTAMLDADLIEQALVNLLRNAVEAAGPGGAVELEAEVSGPRLLLRVQDDGPGITGADNLFVPFFTTKPGGSGIGLVLSRQIAELHGGTLTLQDRPGRRGAMAVLELPLRGGRGQ
jgi:two-component system, NtrC family, nitrogen regulation sensor histidine kinase NtrY